LFAGGVVDLGMNRHILLLLFIGLAWGQPDIYDVYTTESQLGLTITNYGLLGNGWNRMEDGSIHPSCQYKQHTDILREQVEHFSYAGLWVGGIVDGQRRVSTSIVDGVFDAGDEGFEFFSMSGIDVMSEVSDQDIITGFKDFGEDASDPDGIPNHIPLGIQIELKGYSWDFSPVDPFVILEYEITNASTDNIQDMYAGMWVNANVANFNYTDIYTPGGGFSWSDNLDGFDESEDGAGFTRDIGYQYDANGDDGWAESYIGISALGSNVPYNYLNTNYFQWVWTNSNNSDYPAYSMPITDEERYDKMSSSVPKGSGPDYTSEGYPASENSWLFLTSIGPLGSQPQNADSTSWMLAPGESCHIAFTVVCALWTPGIGGNSHAQREKLHINYDWAQKAYDGEDINRNNQLDAGEDIVPNGVLDRYILPPHPPDNLTVAWQYPTVNLYWDAPDESVDGYNIYKSQEQYGEYSLLNSTLITANVFTDVDVSDDSSTSYYIVSVNEFSWESGPSNIIKDYSLPPEISFRYLSNPQIADIGGDTSFTFPTRTFNWELLDPDGNETISEIYYALDDTCVSCWILLEPYNTSITLNEILPGFHNFFLKAIDDFNMSSQVIHFPDTIFVDEPDYWKVMPVIGNVLLVDDYPLDNSNNTQEWYKSILDTIVGSGNYSVWEIGDELPYSQTDVTANLDYFDHVIWYAAYNNSTSSNDTYNEAEASLLNFTSNGGNLFINPIYFEDPTFSWFPLDSLVTLNSNGGRIYPGRVIESPIDTSLNLAVSHLIPVTVKGIWPDTSEFENLTEIYRMADPQDNDGWVGNPTVCSMGQYPISPIELSGKIVIMTLPLHDGYQPKLDGNGNSSKFIEYILEENFQLDIKHDENVNPITFKLSQAFPNPFNPTTIINYEINKKSHVQLSIYDVLGREIKTLINKNQGAGYKSIQWNATNNAGQPVSAGLYLYTIKAGDYSQTKKMVLLK
jgi:hypothetical protein